MTSKADEITTTLRTEILRGQYRPGERLPSERDLAARFEANRGPVREAIKKLEQLGIAEVKPGGVRVVPIEDATLEVLGHLMELGDYPRPELIAQLFDVLSGMAGMSAISAVHNADDSQIGAMLEIIERIRANHGSPETDVGWRDLADYFNTINNNLVARLIGNGLKTQFVGRLQSLGIRPNIDRDSDLQLLIRMEQAVRKRDAKAVGETVALHFTLLKEGLLDALDEQMTPGRTQHA